MSNIVPRVAQPRVMTIILTKMAYIRRAFFIK